MIQLEPLFAKLFEEPKVGGADRDRTDDLRLAKPALSQLSYSPGHNFSSDFRLRALRDEINDRRLASYPPTPFGHCSLIGRMETN